MFDFVTVWLFLATRAILSRCGHPLNQDNSLWAPNSLFLYSPLFSFSGFFLCGFVVDLKVIALNQSFGSFVSSIASALALMSSHHQISSFSAPIQSTDRPPLLISF
ncbi:hypothetical protein HanHA300_Chr06g0220801 [Helianthus annuus]|nr:hypothetical protein HanHA300_Chr06g0220801 [Helianthus annuus]